MNPKRIAPILPILPCLFALSAPTPAADLHVPADHPTIQAAVDAAQSGDAIHIAAGVYSEQTTIKFKNLSVIGQPGTILRAFPNMARGDGTNRWNPILYINRCEDVTIRGIAFEGDQLADQQDPETFGFSGVYYLEAGGTVENCRFTGFREKNPGTTGAFALRFWNDLAGVPLRQARAANNVIEDSYIGISLVGAPDKVSYHLTIENNTITGVGPNPTGAGDGMRGISVDRGITGSIVGNTVSGFSWYDDGIPYRFPYAWGIIAVSGNPGSLNRLDPIRFENNTLRDNNLHMVLLRADNHEVLNNHFDGTAPSLRSAGLWFTGDSLDISGNSFRDLPVGIRTGGVDPEFGTGLGIATNAQLSNNRFRDVITTVETQPQATPTEVGSLLYPFPTPNLTIEDAVLVSWPSYYESWSLQYSEDMETWDVLDLPVMEQAGASMITVPTDDGHEFFRLIETPNP